ncbi:MAG: IS630 transposase-related protein [Rickettsiaceae bacterium]
MKIDMQQLQADIAQYSDAYQYERAERLNVSQSAMVLLTK